MDFEHGRTAGGTGEPELRKGGWEPHAEVQSRYVVQTNLLKGVNPATRPKL